MPLPADLEPGVDGEGARRGVHAGHVLTVVYILQCQLLPVIPAGWSPQAHRQACQITPTAGKRRKAEASAEASAPCA